MEREYIIVQAGGKGSRLGKEASRGIDARKSLIYMGETTGVGMHGIEAV